MLVENTDLYRNFSVKNGEREVEKKRAILFLSFEKKIP